FAKALLQAGPDRVRIGRACLLATSLHADLELAPAGAGLLHQCRSQLRAIERRAHVADRLRLREADVDRRAAEEVDAVVKAPVHVDRDHPGEDEQPGYDDHAGSPLDEVDPRIGRDQLEELGRGTWRGSLAAPASLLGHRAARRLL